MGRVTLVLDKIGLEIDRVTVIDDVRLTLDPGSLNVLLGPTLSGKTTIMRLMAGLDKPTSGRLWLDGQDVTGVPVRKRSVAMVYQQFVNYPSLNVYENIASPLRVAGLPKSEIHSRVVAAARVLRLEKLLQRMPNQLSGGQQQRTAIARALVKQAGLVLLDEPLANLDYKLREELREELPRIFSRTGAILVYATTEPSEALLLGGQTITLSEGRVTQFGETSRVYHDPQNIDSARVFSDPPLNELAVSKQGASVLHSDGERLCRVDALSGQPNGAYCLAFRSDAASIGPPRLGALSFSGKVLVTEISGSESFVHVDVGSSAWVCLVPGVHDFALGEVVNVNVDVSGVFAFDSNGVRVATGQPIASDATVGQEAAR
jgi:glycerol transport system ATP-binding protein